MKKIDIYHYQSKKFTKFFPAFLEKNLSDDKKILIVFSDEKKMQTVDKLLWEFNPDSWIPHLLSSDENSKNARIILTTNSNENLNNAELLCIIDTTIPYDEAKNFERIICFFEQDTDDIKSFTENLKSQPDTEFHSYTQQPNGKWSE